MSKTVVIDCFSESARWYTDASAVVAVDVIRATTTAITAVALGRECIVVSSLEAAREAAACLTTPLMVGELGGDIVPGFDLTNSPCELAARHDVHRPMILLSTSGTRLIAQAEAVDTVYVACLRNHSAQAAQLVAHHDSVVLIGAGTRGEFREEDQLCCAWIAEALLRAGYTAKDRRTEDIVERWRGAPVAAISSGASAAYLRRTGQLRDLEFVLAHVDDIGETYRAQSGRVVRVHDTTAARPTAA
jgi:2-phosphosulfolactate phosphatase